MLIAQVAVMLNGTVDTILAGQISPLDLATVGIGASIYAAIFVSAMGVLLALTPIIAHHYGAGNNSDIGEEVRQGAWLAVALSAITVIVMLHPGSLLAISKLTPEMDVRVRDYLSALAWAAHVVSRRGGGEALMYCVHADWSIGDVPRYQSALRLAGEVAVAERALVTIGVVPSRPDPGFGYIQPEMASGPGARRVARFVEKPTREVAQQFVDAGFLWNSGIFVWQAGVFLEELARHCLEVAPALSAHPDDANAFFAAVKKPIAVDVGVLERSDRVFVVPGDFGWDDVGTWAALHRVRVHDAHGNAVSGVAHVVDARGNVVHAERGTVVLYGVDDLVVVTRPGLTLVTTREQSADLKTLLDALPASVRELRPRAEDGA